MDSCPLSLDMCHEWKGFWWLPESPGERISGVLKFNPKNGLTLSLSFPSGDSFSCPSSRWEVLYGEVDGLKLTLFDCFPNSPKPEALVGYMEGNSLQLKVKIERALINSHYEIDASFCFAEFSVAGLGEWAGMLAAGGASRPADLPEIEIREEGEQVIKANGKLRGYDLSLRCTSSPGDRDGEGVYLRVSSSKGLTLGEVIENVRLMQEIMAFALQNTLDVIWVRLGTDSSLDRKSYSRIDLLYSPSLNGNDGIRYLRGEMPFFTCEHLSFERLVPQWYDIRYRLSEAINMVMSLHYAPSPYVESNLLMVVGAAEVLHRRLGIHNRIIPISNRGFKKMRRVMLGKVFKEYGEYKDKLRESISIRNEPILKDRLLDLAKRLDPKVIDLLCLDIGHWAQRTTKVRNNLTHEGEACEFSLEELDAIVEVTRAVVVLNLLKELDLSSDRQQEIVREHPQFSRAARLAKECLAGGSKGRTAIEEGA